MAALATAAFALPLPGVGLAASTVDFGEPPSGEVPILFNDHHVYARPDRLQSGRLLAAIARGKTLYVPMRSLLEQLGATVSYDPVSRTAVIEKPDATISLTVGVAQAIIDGQARPLDVPPIVIGGNVFVPVRAIAEAMGAYVAYVPDERIVVVRSIADVVPAPPALVLPAQRPSIAPPPRPIVPPGPPIPVSTPLPETYVIADALIAPKVYNAFSSGRSGSTGSSFAVRAATEFSALDIPLVLDGSYTRYAYTHPAGPVTAIGSASAAFVPSFGAQDNDFEVHLGAQLTPHKYDVAVGYGSFATTYGYPRIGGLGLGLEKLPVLENTISYSGSAFYYPNASGACTPACPPGTGTFAYAMLTYRAGVTYSMGRYFFDAGYQGDRGYRKSGPPVNVVHGGAFVGFGARIQ